MDKSSSSSSSSAPPPDSLNSLKFGKKIYFQGPKPVAPPHSPAKKGRNAVAQGARCQVEGCQVDLSGAKAYYSRHKVCGMHSKSPKVIVGGLEQRFCQQCSRFHQLPEFDQGKRSCRRRLAGHNERRRKPPAGSLLSPRYGTLCPSLFDNCSKSTGGFVMDFSSYPTLPNQQLPYSQNQLSGYSPGPGPGPGGPGPGQECSFNGVSDSNSALSLLSNQQPWGSRAPLSTSSLGANGFIGTSGPGPTMVNQPFSWGFKGNNTMHEMPPDLGLGQSSHTSNNSQYNTNTSGGLGLGQPSEGQFQELDHSRGYDSSVQHMHWTL